MRKLIQFLINNVFFFIFLLLEVISMALIVNFNDFQQSVFLTSASGITGRLHQITNSTTEYFGLKKKNEDLIETNARLSNELALLKARIQSDDVILCDTDINPEEKFTHIPAKVINNTTHKEKNYITLNRGTVNNIRTEMGVVSDQGVVGIVTAVSDHFAIVTSVLNSGMKISSKFKKNNFAGLIVWNGRDYRYAKMVDISEHVDLQVGDTIITTGFTSIFPEGIPIGVVENFEMNNADTYYDIDVRLFTDFKRLSHVNILNYAYKEEEVDLENRIQ